MKRREEVVGIPPAQEEPPARSVSSRQQYAIRLLLDGRSEAEVARLVEIRRSQLRAWKENPRFRWAWANARPEGESWILGGIALFETRRRRRRAPEVPWTTEEGTGTDD